MKSKDKPVHDTTIIKQGGSLYMRIPPTIRDFINVDENSDMKLQAEHGKHGKYGSFWKDNK